MTYDKNQHLELVLKNQTLKSKNQVGFCLLTDEKRILLNFERVISNQIHWSYRDFYVLILYKFSQNKIKIEQ